MRRLTLLVATVAVACSRPLPPPPPVPVVVLDPPTVVSPWPAVLANARRAAASGRFADADRILAEFAVQNAGTAEGADADFWRALFRADPLNKEVNVRDQLAAFDTYLNGGPTMPRYGEAEILRRMVEVIDSTRATVVAVRAAADARDQAKQDEVKRLSDELEKALSELERIKRRLMPKPETKKPPL